MGDVDLRDLDKAQGIILERISNFREDVANKQNEFKIELQALRSEVKANTDDIWKLKIKIVGYTSLAGVVTSLVIKLIDHAMK